MRHEKVSNDTRLQSCYTSPPWNFIYLGSNSTGISACVCFQQWSGKILPCSSLFAHLISVKAVLHIISLQRFLLFYVREFLFRSLEEDFRCKLGIRRWGKKICKLYYFVDSAYKLLNIIYSQYFPSIISVSLVSTQTFNPFNHMVKIYNCHKSFCFGFCNF